MRISFDCAHAVAERMPTAGRLAAAATNVRLFIANPLC
jgi:hypothetical protein